MDRHNGTGFGGDRFFYFLGVDIQRDRVDVHKYRHGAFVTNRICRRDEGERRNDDLIAFADIQCADAQVQPGGSGTDRDRMRERNRGRYLRFELLRHRPQAQPRRPQHGNHGFNFCLGDIGCRQRYLHQSPERFTSNSAERAVVVSTCTIFSEARPSP
jgi:hypothetical protein